MKVGDRVLVTMMTKEQHDWALLKKEGNIEHDFCLTGTENGKIQNLYCVRFDDQTHANVWSKQIEVI